MMRRATFATATAACLVGCTAADVTDRSVPNYGDIETRLLSNDLVNFVVEMRGAADAEAVTLFARCAAAQYALIRGYGFARHVRTHVHAEGSLWRGDAVYTVSPSLPAGLTRIDAEVTVADCKERGIPTV